MLLVNKPDIEVKDPAGVYWKPVTACEYWPGLDHVAGTSKTSGTFSIVMTTDRKNIREIPVYCSGLCD